jgi:hypothetical protein
MLIAMGVLGLSVWFCSFTGKNGTLNKVLVVILDRFGTCSVTF